MPPLLLLSLTSSSRPLPLARLLSPTSPCPPPLPPPTHQVVSRDIRRILTERARYFNIILEDVSITNLTFSKEYTAAVEAKQVAQQEAERAKFIVSGRGGAGKRRAGGFAGKAGEVDARGSRTLRGYGRRGKACVQEHIEKRQTVHAMQQGLCVRYASAGRRHAAHRTS